MPMTIHVDIVSAEQEIFSGLAEISNKYLGKNFSGAFEKGADATPQLWLEDPKDILTALQDYRPFIGWILERLQDDGSRTVVEAKGGKWLEVDPIKCGVEIPMAQGGKKISQPYFCGNDFFGMLPTDLSRIKPVEMDFSPFPPQLDAVLREQALSVLSGQSDTEVATSIFYDTIANDPTRWLKPLDDPVQIAKMWVRALGRKGGRAARFDCWFTDPMWNVGGYYLTSVALAAAVRMVLRGEIKKRGVITAEKAFEPLSFMDEVVALIPDLLPEGEIINSSFDWLD